MSIYLDLKYLASFLTHMMDFIFIVAGFGDGLDRLVTKAEKPALVHSHLTHGVNECWAVHVFLVKFA